MKIIPSFNDVSLKTKETFKLFPIILIWAILGTLYALYTIENGDFDDFETGKIILTFSLGISWLIATRFFIEQFKKTKKWILIIPLLFLVLFYFHLPTDKKNLGNTYLIRFALLFLSGHLFILTAFFVLKWNKNAFFNYLKSVFNAIVKSLFFSLILYLGVVLALLAIKHLFNIDIKGKRFFQIFIICLGIINTWLFLSEIPKNIYSQTTVNYAKAIEVLIKYILIPLVILYLIILYAYSLKIVINWNLPKGWVSYLVIALSFLGFIVQVLINPIQDKIDSSTVIKKFYPWFYYFLIPLIGLLFVAIFKRINEYGITENRYFVLTLACWILAMSLYMLFYKNNKTRIFPLSLAVISILISFGFWGAFSISTKSQVNQFKNVFTEIKNNNFNTSYKKKNQLKSIIRYLNTKEDLDKLTNVLGYNPKEVFKTKSNWDLQNKLLDSLAIKLTDKPNYKNNHYNLKESNLIIDIKNYDFLKNVYLRENNKDDVGFYLIVQSKSNNIGFWNNKNFIGNIDCSNLVKRLKNQHKNYDIEQEKMTITKEFKNYNVKLIFKDISIHRETENYINYANAYLLIKENAK